MALENTQSFVTVVGDGSIQSIPVTFPLLDPSHLSLYGYKADSTPFVYNAGADYTVITTSNPQDNTPIYTVQLTRALASGWKLTVARQVPVIQEVVFDNQGGVEPKIYEYQLDYLTMICQQLQRQIDLRLPFPDNVNPADVIDIIYNSTATLNQIQAAVAAVEAELANKAVLNHIHTIDNVTGLRAGLNSKADAVATNNALALKADAIVVAGKADKSALDGKSDKGHTHVINDVANFQSVVNATVKTEVNKAIEDIDDFGTFDHSELNNRDMADQHPQKAIVNLERDLAAKASTSELSAEATARDTADSGLQGQIATLTTNKADKTALQAEETARSNADSSLQGQINAKADASALAGYATTTALSTGLAAKADKTYVDTQVATKANAHHTQGMDTINGLNAALDGKADVSDLANYATTTQLGTLAAQNDAPTDGKEYNRKNGQWVEDTGGGESGLPSGGSANDILGKDASNVAGWRTPAQMAAILPKGTDNAFGLVRADGTTITSSGGILTAVGGGGGTGTSDHTQLSNRSAADQHPKSAITDLEDTLDDIAGVIAAKADASALANYATTSALNSGLSGKANASHSQGINTITGLQFALDSKANAADLDDYATMAALNAGLADKADAATTASALAGKANTNHTQATSTITGLQAALDAKAGTTTATQTANGLMSFADKTKLDGLSSSGDGGAGIVGEIRLLPWRRADLPSGWYFCNGDRYSLSTAQGAALNSLPAAYKTDWEITVSGSTINLPSLFNGSDGYFLRPADNSTRQPGSRQEDAIRNITGGMNMATASGLALNGATVGTTTFTGALTSSAFSKKYFMQTIYCGPDQVGDLAFDASGSVPTAEENRPLNIGMTPAIYLGV